MLGSICEEQEEYRSIYQKDEAERHVNPVSSSKTGSYIKGSGNKVN